jgi:hypothetical protein
LSNSRLRESEFEPIALPVERLSMPWMACLRCEVGTKIYLLSHFEMVCKDRPGHLMSRPIGEIFQEDKVA